MPADRTDPKSPNDDPSPSPTDLPPGSSRPRRFRRLRRIVRYFLIFLAVTISILAVRALIDEELQPADDLAWEPMSDLAAEDDAYVGLVSALSLHRPAIGLSDEEMSAFIAPWAESDESSGSSEVTQERIAEYLDANRSYLEAIEVALARPGYRSPAPTDDPDDPSSERQGLKPVVRLLGLASVLHARSGDVARAERMIEMARALSVLLFTQGEGLIPYSYGLELAREAAVASRDLAVRVEEATPLERLAESLDALPDFERALERYFRIDYLRSLEWLEEEHPQAVAFLFKPQQTRNMIAEGYRSLIDTGKLGGRLSFVFEGPAWTQMADFATGGNTRGLRLVIRWSMGASAVAGRTRRVRAEIIGIRLLVGIRRHEITTGQLPGSLDELVSEYGPLNAELRGVEFHYRPTERTLRLEGDLFGDEPLEFSLDPARD